jgi:hypothetical protein
MAFRISADVIALSSATSVRVFPHVNDRNIVGLESVIAVKSQNSCTPAQDSAASTIDCHQENQKRNCVRISSTMFGECDLIDEDNMRTFPKKFLSIFDIGSQYISAFSVSLFND